MQGRVLAAFTVCLIALGLGGGCQLSGLSLSTDSNTLAPRFGLDFVPRQSEPPVDDEPGETAGSLAQADREGLSGEMGTGPDEGSGEKQAARGGFFKRLFAGGEKKEGAKPRSLPVTGRSEAKDQDDDWD
jgi:hypothetical protein